MDKKTTATMVEHMDDYNQWQWYEVTFMPPKEAVQDYIDTHSENWRDEKIIKSSEGYEAEDLVRAFEITII